MRKIRELHALKKVHLELILLPESKPFNVDNYKTESLIHKQTVLRGNSIDYTNLQLYCLNIKSELSPKTGFS